MFRPRRQGKFAPEFPEFQGFPLWKSSEKFLTDRATNGDGLRLDHWKENFGPLRRGRGMGRFRRPGGDPLCLQRRVVAKSAQLRFRLAAKTALAPLLLLFPTNPLRWALLGTLNAKRRFKTCGF